VVSISIKYITTSRHPKNFYTTRDHAYHGVRCRTFFLLLTQTVDNIEMTSTIAQLNLNLAWLLPAVIQWGRC